MIANFGYKNGSGDYFISIDTDKCDGCGDCVPVCPAGMLEVCDNEFDPLSDCRMAIVKDEFRKKIKYACSPCKPAHAAASPPCIAACLPGAIKHS